MKTFEIEVLESLSRVLKIEAGSQNEAILKVEEMYRNEEIVLDYDDFKNMCISPKNQSEEKDKLIADVIQYLYLEEKKHYEESEEKENHIFLKINTLRKMLKISI